jgi:Fe2+ transport system protein FeoA
MLRRWIRRGPPPKREPPHEDAAVRRLTDLDVGASASIAFIAPTSSARINKLASFGLVPGSEVRLVSRRPAVVLECGATSIAVEDEIGRDIYARVSAA